MTWIVTGGAGYVGSEIAYQLLAAGKDVLVVDDLSTGSATAVPSGAAFLEFDLRNPRMQRHLPRGERFDGVIHAAGIKYAGESVKRPEEHYSRNVEATQVLLDVCHDLGIPRFIFSSSSSVYGTPKSSPVTEEAPLLPESPYGRSKVAAEWMIRDFALAYGISSTCLRFFNVAGVGGSGVADRSPFNLFPNLVRALEERTEFELYGTGLGTPDGTCIRDYVHVSDIASGHLAVIAAWENGRTLAHTYNLGSGQGTSVRQILNAFERVAGFSPAVSERAQRPGDPLVVWASNQLANSDLGWTPKITVEEMVASAIRFNPGGC